MKKFLLILLVFIVVIATGCQKVVETAVEKKLEAETGVDVDINMDSDEWCNEGDNWKMSSLGQEEDGSVKMVIQGLETSGKYEGLCYIKYEIIAEGETTTMDLYLDEEGGGYQIVEANGQTFEMEWSG